MAGDRASAVRTKQFRQVLIGIYLIIAVGFAFYGLHHGDSQGRGFAFSFGRGLVWPFLLFPVLGKIGGVILILLILLAVLGR